MEELVDGALRRYPVAVAPAPIRVDPMPAEDLARAGERAGRLARGPAARPASGWAATSSAGTAPTSTRFPGFAIAGPPYSGRSTALVVLATSLLSAGAAVIAVTPRESPLRALDGRDGVLAVFKEASPDQRKLYELLEGAAGRSRCWSTTPRKWSARRPTSCSPRSRRGAARGQALVIAGTSADLARGIRSLAAAAGPYNCGLLLTPDDTQMANQLLGLRITRSAPFDGPRARLPRPAGQPTLVQVPELSVSW